VRNKPSLDASCRRNSLLSRGSGGKALCTEVFLQQPERAKPTSSLHRPGGTRLMQRLLSRYLALVIHTAWSFAPQINFLTSTAPAKLLPLLPSS
jgi:hypothetical protein